MKKFKRMTAVAAVVASLGMTAVWAANSPNLTITADQLSYDGKSGKATAVGNLVITKDDKVMTGSSGWYNTKSEEAYLTGGVKMTGTNMQMRAGELHSYGNKEIHAIGDAYLQREDKTVEGQEVMYHMETEYGKATGNAKLTMKDATMTADVVEGWLKEIRAVGIGNVHLHSDTHKLDATGDRVDYTQTPNREDGVAYLRGNAHAVQNGNELMGPELKIEMKDNSVETIGRSTLVITPK